jgi:hypothetical protein
LILYISGSVADEVADIGHARPLTVTWQATRERKRQLEEGPSEDGR